jgi:nitroreductase
MELTNLVPDKSTLKKAIIKSQHCQRNWDLERQIPEEDLEILEFAATQCPSKQNVAHYKVHMITNRDLIEKIHAETNGFVYRDTPLGPKPDTPKGPNDTDVKYTTNTQVLANLLIVLEDYTDLSLWGDRVRNTETRFISTGQDADGKRAQVMQFDRNVAVGIAAGYLNLTATLLGYSTGCCSCMNHDNIAKILGMKTHPLLLMGIGFKDPNKNRRIHQLRDDFVFPTKPKQEIPVVRHY